MISKQDIIQKAKEFGFEDTGFTTAEPGQDAGFAAIQLKLIQTS